MKLPVDQERPVGGRQSAWKRSAAIGRAALGMNFSPIRSMVGAAMKLFEPVRPQLQAEQIASNAKGTDRDKAECLDHLVRAWSLHVAIRRQYRAVPLTGEIDKFVRSTIPELTPIFIWLRQETRTQILAIIFAAIIRSGTHSETEVRNAINQIAVRLIEEVPWPP